MSDRTPSSPKCTASAYTKLRFFDPQISREALQRKIQDPHWRPSEIVRTRRKKGYDLRPLILDLDLIHIENDEPGLHMTLLAEPGQTGRPDEVLDEMGYQNTEVLFKRTKLILSYGPA